MGKASEAWSQEAQAERQPEPPVAAWHLTPAHIIVVTSLANLMKSCDFYHLTDLPAVAAAACLLAC